MQWHCRMLMMCQITVAVHAGSALAATQVPQQASDTPLYLSVSVNGQSRNLIAEFVRDSQGRLRSRARELADVGIDPGCDPSVDTWIYLDRLTQVSFTYDAAGQQISFTVDPSRTTFTRYDLRGPVDDVPLLTSGTGLVLNYSASGQVAKRASAWTPQFNGLSTYLDGRFFSPKGILIQTGLARLPSLDHGPEIRRYDTTWTRSNPSLQITSNAGDIISGGLGWTRPIRMGGVQIRRNFSTRPDLITYPLPSLEGTAAVPSTVDIYLGKLRLNSIDVDTGRFQLNNLPVPNKNGELRMVVQDATGGLHEQSLSFGASRLLLRPGLTDFSEELGVARTGFATDDDKYGSRPVASASLRRGLNDEVTIEGHAEAGAGLANIGVGVVVGSARVGTIQLSAAGSAYHGQGGSQLSASYDYSLGPATLQLDGRGVLGTYADLADVTAAGGPDLADPDRITSYARIQVGTQLWDDLGWLGVGYAHTASQGSGADDLVNAAFTHQLGSKAQFTLSTQAQLGHEHEFSANAGLSCTLGPAMTSSSGSSVQEGNFSTDMSVAKTQQQNAGSWGYGANLHRSEHDTSGSLLLSRYGETSQTTAIIDGSGSAAQFYGNMQGGLAMMGGDVFLSRSIDDSLAVVDAGSPNVTVYHENHKIGRTGRNGKLLVPGIRAYEGSKLAIEPNDLPVDSTISQTSRLIALPDHSGVVVSFAGKSRAGSPALVVLKDVKGDFLPPGSIVKLAGSAEDIVVGYDGEAFITTLKDNNEITVDTGSSSCMAKFAFQHRAPQPRVGPVVCR